jgi:endo-1,4-beta-mannosidase
VELAQCADDRGLKLWVTLFTGHVHGANWLPAWMVRSNIGDGSIPTIVSSITSNRMPRNPYIEEDVLDAQHRFIREVLAALQGHPALWGWDLGNQPSSLFRPAHRAHGMKWLKAMVEEIRSRDQEHSITLGLHQADLEEDRGMGPAEVGQVCDLISIQGHPAFTPWSRGPADPLFPLFLAALTRWLGEGAEVWISGLGVPTGLEDADRFSVDEEEAARYASESLEGLRRYDVSGALWWCYGDYAYAVCARPPFDDRPHERSFGLVTRDGRPKATVEAICGMSRDRGGEILPSEWIDLEPQEYWRDPAGEIKRLYERFLDQVSWLT